MLQLLNPISSFNSTRSAPRDEFDAPIPNLNLVNERRPGGELPLPCVGRVNQLAKTIERMKSQLPQHYRPLARPTKTSGLLERELPWAEKQRRAAAEVEAEQRKPRAPRA
jgi:hypothetical protein